MKLVLAIPSYKGLDREQLLELRALCDGLIAAGHEADAVMYQRCSESCRARAEIEYRAMRVPGVTHVLFLEDDVRVRLEDVLALLDLDVDVVVAPCLLADGRFNVNLWPTSKVETRAGHRVIDVMHSGLACMLVRASVLTKLRELHPELAYESDDGSPRVSLFLPMVLHVPGVSARFLAADYAFCFRLFARGFRVLALVDAITVHDHMRGCFGDTLERAIASPNLSAAE